AIGATKGYIYVRGEFIKETRILEKVIYEAKKLGFLGNNILNSNFDFDITIIRGAGAYICGEETALIESIEGKQGKPRIKPPFPANKGLFGCPTVINNVETLACVPYIILMGGEKYANIGTLKSTGTKLFSVSGPVKKPGVYEIELGKPFRKFFEEELGGMIDGEELKAVIVGGTSVPILTAEEAMKVNLDYESLAQAGTMLGSGGMIIISKNYCMVDLLEVIVNFYHHESCGQCSPCREGSGWLKTIIKKIKNATANINDIQLAMDIANNMIGKTICTFADALAMPVISFINKFKTEFEEHIRGNCKICQK
ncbi:MAG: SLBB domain-containing protein, partial [Candidatus Goldbacteria bacterium]|nr:SLBB domain-containing protein [Candidatus Goldiibacteriota bacterium]